MTAPPPPHNPGPPWPPPQRQSPPGGYPAPPAGGYPPWPPAGPGPHGPAAPTAGYPPPPARRRSVLLWTITGFIAFVVGVVAVQSFFHTLADMRADRHRPAPPTTTATAALSAPDEAYLRLIAATPPTITDRSVLLTKGHEVCEYYRIVDPDSPAGLKEYLMQWFAIRNISQADGDIIAAAAINGLCPQYKTKSGY